MVEYNGNSNLDDNENIKFIDDDLPCNKQSIQLVANNFIIRFKKKITDNKNNESSRHKAI